MRHLYKFAITAIILLLTACRPSTPQEFPTLIPSPTSVPPTATQTATSTPSGPTPTVPYAPQNIANDPADQVYLRVVHAASNVATIDVYVEMLAVATNLNFAQNSEPSGVVAGDYVLRVVPAGTRPTDSPLLEQQMSFEGGQSLMLLISCDANGLTITTFTESNEPLNLGESRLTVIHALIGGPAVSVREGNTELIPPLNFGNESTPIILTSGRTTLAFQSGGTTLISHVLDLREKYNHTLVLVGNAPENAAVVSYDALAPSRASVRIINASAPIGSVDVYLNDTPLAQDAAFGRPTEFMSTLAQVYTVGVYAADANRTQIEPLISAQLTTNADDMITLILLGPPDDLRLLDYREDTAPTPLGEARIAFLNTLYNLPIVALDSAEGPIENVSQLNYAQVPIEVPVLAATHTFNWTNPEGDLVEIAENIELEAGRTYLYLFTGRMDNAPVIVSSSVGIDESLPTNIIASSEGDTPTSTSGSPTQVRLVNAIMGDLPIDFSIDDQIVAAGLAYRQGSDLLTIERGDHNISISLSETTDILARTDSFLEDGRFSLFATGVMGGGIQILIVPDESLIFDGQSPHIRLINTSFNPDVHFGLAYSPATEGVSNPDQVSTESEDVRRTIPFGLQRLVDYVEWQNFSSVVLMPIGAFDIYVIDSDQAAIAATIPSVTLEAGAHYDIIAYQENESQRVRAFVVEYPVRSG